MSEKDGMSREAERVEAEEKPQGAECEETTAEPSVNGKARRSMNLLYDLILVAGVLMLVGGGAYIARKYIGEKKSTELYNELEDQFVTTYAAVYDAEEEAGIDVSGWVWSSADASADSVLDGTIWYRRVKVDLEGLQKINSDVAGWIFFENEQISYPIMYSGDSSYLYADLYGNYSTQGSLFLQGDNTPDFEDSLSVVYGHNMKNGAMFGKLKQYRTDADYYEEHQYFQIFVGDQVYRYRIFAYFLIGETEVDMVNVNFTDQVDRERLYSTYLAKLEEWEAQQEAAYEQAVAEAEAKRLAEAEEGAERLGIPLEDYLGLYSEEVEIEWEPEEPAWMSYEYIQTDYTFQEYLNQVSRRSLINSGIEVTAEDKVVALFTCSVHGDGKRFIVYGVRVDAHDFGEVEDETGEVEFLDR